ncbi:NAD(P)-dependent oxidoreductase [Actinoalloteichus fjordicus]|nr:NAD(P)-binding domain-containing protein [Actinoalloteichus fjordicus]
MTSVTVLGLGPMGHALAAACTAADHPTTVWNRTPGRGADLDADVADTAAEATTASPLVLVCVRDYTVAQSILDVDALRGRTLVNLSGGAPREARALAAWAREHDIDYLDAVIMATPDAIGTPDAALFFSGPQDVYAKHQAVLTALGENGIYLGDDAGRAAGFDAALQDLFWTAMSGIVHTFALATAEGIKPADIAEHAKAMVGMFPDLIDQVADQVTTGRFPGDDAAITTAAAAMDHILDTVRSHDLDNGVLSAARAEVQQAIDAGHGSSGYARLATR